MKNNHSSLFYPFIVLVLVLFTIVIVVGAVMGTLVIDDEFISALLEGIGLILIAYMFFRLMLESTY